MIRDLGLINVVSMALENKGEIVKDLHMDMKIKRPGPAGDHLPDENRNMSGNIVVCSRLSDIWGECARTSEENLREPGTDWQLCKLSVSFHVETPLAVRLVMNMTLPYSQHNRLKKCLLFSPLSEGAHLRTRHLLYRCI